LEGVTAQQNAALTMSCSASMSSPLQQAGFLEPSRTWTAEVVMIHYFRHFPFDTPPPTME
jgi:hypothetical protein